MTHTEIDSGFRELTRAGILKGWYSFVWRGRRWTITPANGPTQTFSKDEAIDYLQFAASAQ